MKQYKPKYVEKILFSRKQVESAVKKAAAWVTKKYKNAKKRPIFLCVLKGATPFFSQLLLDVELECNYEFITLSSFRGQLKAVTKPKIISTTLTNIKNRDIIIVEDVIDTARSLSALKKYLKDKGAKSVATVVLVDKHDMRQVPYNVDYCCFKLAGNPFIIGWGLDVKEVARNLPYIASFDKKYFDKL
ncbi:MAG: hypoxanthine phosphoribosyltransferase [Mycoplasmoidaceae bacterium]